ncbi:DNA primase [candidate division KSB1 bacterium]|nr:DNA primase [candidate division KSB1 bacterium]
MSSRISPDKVDQVRQASDIAEVVSGYLSLKQRGKNYFGLCPFHPEKTPSFSVNPEMQIFHCFGCGAGGNVFTFVMMMEKITFPEAVRMLAQAAGIVLPEDEQNLSDVREKEALFVANKIAHDFFSDNLLHSPEAKAARSYLLSRGIDQQMMQTYAIGYAPDRWDGLIRYAAEKQLGEEVLLRAGLVIQNESGRIYDRFRNRITFAVHGISGQLVAFGARRMNDDDNSPKYINSPETDIYQKRFTLYGLFWAREAIRRNKRAIFVEGYTDVLSLAKIGLQEVVATSGTSLTQEHARLIRRYTPQVVLLYDADSAGAQAALRGADILLENGLDVLICTLPLGSDPDDFARREGLKGIETLFQSARPLMDHKIDQLNSEGQMRSAAQRAEATRLLLDSVSKVNDRLQQSYLLRELASKLQVEESVLWSELKKSTRRTHRATESEAEAPSENTFFYTKRGSAELGVLETILLFPQLTPHIMTVLSHADFKNREIARIFRQIETDLLHQSEYDPQSYVASVEDPVIARHLSARVDNKPELKVAKKFALDCIITLYLVKIREEIDRLRLEMRRQKSDESDLHPYLHRIRELEEQKTVVESRKGLDETSFFE